MASSGGLESRLSSSGGSGAVAAWIGERLVALWASRRLSAWVARSLSLKSKKIVMVARTGSGKCRNQRAWRTSILLLLPAVSGGRRQRDFISVRASDGRWSPRACLERLNSVLTFFLQMKKTFSGGKFWGPGSRWGHRPWSPTSPTSEGRACQVWQRGCGWPAFVHSSPSSDGTGPWPCGIKWGSRRWRMSVAWSGGRTVAWQQERRCLDRQAWRRRGIQFRGYQCSGCYFFLRVS